MGPRRVPAVGEGEEYVLQACDAPLYNVNDTKERAIVEWRDSCFTSLGFSVVDSLTLALRRDVDRVEVARLLDAGARHETVVGIVT